MKNVWETSRDLLLVEDNPGDVALVKEALRLSGFMGQLFVVEDGQKALKVLRRVSPFDNAQRPALVLLDLNLPRMDGRETLAEIKNDPDLRGIPVIIFSTSTAEEDMAHCYDLHCNCFIEKPLNFQEYMDTISAIVNFWCKRVSIPTK